MCNHHTNKRIATFALKDHGDMQNGDKQQADTIEPQQTQVPPGFEQIRLWKQAAANRNHDCNDQQGDSGFQ